MLIGDTVKFINSNSSLAAKFCYDHNIAAVIKKFESNSRVLLDAGIGYFVYAPITDLELCNNVAYGLCDRKELINLIPQPCDDI